MCCNHYICLFVTNINVFFLLFLVFYGLQKGECASPPLVYARVGGRSKSVPGGGTLKIAPGGGKPIPSLPPCPCVPTTHLPRPAHHPLGRTLAHLWHHSSSSSLQVFPRPSVSAEMRSWLLSLRPPINFPKRDFGSAWCRDEQLRGKVCESSVLKNEIFWNQSFLTESGNA